ncbi:MAG: hypothetical protein M0033_01065 [Nitrospiraceae bacterium]|nr:hypothetical protein [Nitrospiraceae bacterium]
MRSIIPRTASALAMLFFISTASASELESRAAGSLLGFADQKFIAENAGDIPSPGKPAYAEKGGEGPYYPGTNEGKAPDFNSPIPNFGLVVEGVYRGARVTTDKHFKFLKDMGITTMVNLQWPLKDDKKLCRKYGFDCSYDPVAIVPFVDWYFDMKALKRTFEFSVNELKAGRKIYIHCHFGRERTGILAAALTIRDSMCGPDRQNDPQLKEKTWKTVEAGFVKYGYKSTYAKPFREMRSWINDFEKNKDWLCR